jgi:hypothetical protein
MAQVAQTNLQRDEPVEVNMIRVTYGTCAYCHNKFTVGDWYDFVNLEGQADHPWVCPGCKQTLKTREITITYEHEGDS